MKRILVLITVLLLVVSAAACGSETTSAPEAVEESATASDSGGTSGDGWVEVISIKGSASDRSASFTLEGGEQKLEYTMEGETMPIMAVYVEAPDWDMQEDGGFPVVMPDKPGSDSTMMEKDAGEYIAQVESANCDWTVTILEKR